MVRHVLAAIAILALAPFGGVAQEAEGASLLRLDLRVGVGQHVQRDARDGVTNFVGDIAIRTRGPLILGGSVGVINSHRGLDISLLDGWTEIDGQVVAIGEGWTFDAAPRLRGFAGYAFQVREVPVELTAEGGWVKTEGTEVPWHPWAVGAVAMRGYSGLGVQLGIGATQNRDQVP